MWTNFNDLDPDCIYRYCVWRNLNDKHALTSIFHRHIFATDSSLVICKANMHLLYGLHDQLHDFYIYYDFLKVKQISWIMLWNIKTILHIQTVKQRHNKNIYTSIWNKKHYLILFIIGEGAFFRGGFCPRHFHTHNSAFVLIAP